MVMHPETAGFGAHLARLGKELDRFVAFDHPDAVSTMDWWRPELDRPLPDTGIGAEAVIDEYVDVVMTGGGRISDPHFWGFITAGPATVPAVVAAASHVAGPQRYTITAFNMLEELSLGWLADLCRLGDMGGVYSSGGSVAQLLALGAARQWAYETAGIDPSADGIASGPPMTLYASTEAHHTVQRAAGVLGLGRRAVRAVPVDSGQRLDPDALDAMITADVAAGLRPMAVVATAGTTNTGAIDPLRAAGEIAARHHAWLHVDGAYGLPGILDERISHLYDGLDLAESVIVDPHKWLNTPVGIAATFVRDRSLLYRAFTEEPAAYLEDAFTADADIRSSLDSMGPVPYADMSVELSSPARGVVVWSVLREIGREGVRARVVADIDRARRVTDLAEAHPRLEALTDPTLSVACFRYVPGGAADIDSVNRTLLRRVVRETSFIPSSTIVGGAYAIRPCFINVRSTDEDVDAFVEAVVRLGDDLTG